MRILVTGASGFIGSRLIPELLAHEHDVRALARDPARVDLDRTGENAAAAEVIAGDVLTAEGLAPALEDVEVAYYLIHSMERPPVRAGGRPHPRAQATHFPERERRGAENFAAAAAAAGVRRIVYLGGPTAGWIAAAGRGAGALSPHLHSRATVERVLREAVPDTVALRASIVIGAGSRSFRLMVRLVERMPVLPLPSWRGHRTRPIDERDAIAMLVAAADTPSVAGRSLDVGGAQELSYAEMLERTAELMLLPRPAVKLGVNATALTARVAAAIAREDPELVIALMESLRGDLLPGGADAQAYLRAAESLGVELHSFDAAVERALRDWETIEPLAAR